jgi:hypothetical protein
MNTTNKSSLNEIFEALNKILKLSFENKFKILIAFMYSTNEKFQEDAKNLFMSKCIELHKEGKNDQLSKSTIENITLIISSVDSFINDSFYSEVFLNFLMESQNKPDEFDYEYKIKDGIESKYIGDIENFMENIKEETIEYEKILEDLGPFINNNSIILNTNMIDYNIDEKRLAKFILFLCKNQTWIEDEEIRSKNKVFLKYINNDINFVINIEENREKNNVLNWNIENFYNRIKDQMQIINVFKIYIVLYFYIFIFYFLIKMNLFK